MLYLSVPSISNLPALSQSSTQDGGSVDPSPLPSGLCTPGETSLQPFEDVLVAAETTVMDERGFTVEEEHSMQVVRNPKLATPKVKPLTRAVSKAKNLAGKALSVRKAFRKVIASSENLSASWSSSSVGPDLPGSWKAERRNEIAISITQEIIRDAEPYSPQSRDKTVDVRDPVDRPAVLPEHECFLRAENSRDALPTSESSLDIRWKMPTLLTVLYFTLRLTFFLPWCAAVGGAILLSPQHLELVAFAPGYMASPKGPQRFAHWADCAVHHVFIFIAFGVTILWWDIAFGATVACAMLARFGYVWSDFQIDPSVPLGEDDRQSVYLAVTQAYINDGDMVIRMAPVGDAATTSEVAEDDDDEDQ